MVWFNGRKIAVAATVAAVIVRFDTTPSYAIDVFGVLGGSSGGSSVGSSGGFSISLSLGSHGGSSGGSSGGFAHRTPAGYLTAYGASVAPVQGFVRVPVRAVALSAPAGPPDPVPKWARPPGRVPVIAIAAPAPRWVNSSALSATHNAANMRAVPYQAVPAQ